MTTTAITIPLKVTVTVPADAWATNYGVEGRDIPGDVIGYTHEVLRSALVNSLGVSDELVSVAVDHGVPPACRFGDHPPTPTGVCRSCRAVTDTMPGIPVERAAVTDRTTPQLVSEFGQLKAASGVRDLTESARHHRLSDVVVELRARGVME